MFKKIKKNSFVYKKEEKLRKEKGWSDRIRKDGGVVAVKASLVPSIGADAPRHAHILYTYIVIYIYIYYIHIIIHIHTVWSHQ